MTLYFPQTKTTHFFSDRPKSTFMTTITTNTGLTGPNSEVSTAPFYTRYILRCSCIAVRIISHIGMHSLCITELDKLPRVEWMIRLLAPNKQKCQACHLNSSFNDDNVCACTSAGHGKHYYACCFVTV
jgi:hypothetical protein